VICTSSQILFLSFGLVTLSVYDLYLSGQDLIRQTSVGLIAAYSSENSILRVDKISAYPQTVRQSGVYLHPTESTIMNSTQARSMDRLPCDTIRARVLSVISLEKISIFISSPLRMTPFAFACRTN
jgi:hypothetical protein